VIAGFKAHQLPISAIHLDIDYMDGFLVFTVDEPCFGDLAALCSELEAQGVKVVTILDPGVKQDADYFMYQEGLRKVISSIIGWKTAIGRCIVRAIGTQFHYPQRAGGGAASTSIF
jgi:hypothetical protein